MYPHIYIKLLFVSYCSYEHNVLIISVSIVHLDDASPLPIVGGKPVGPTCQYE